MLTFSSTAVCDDGATGETSPLIHQISDRENTQHTPRSELMGEGKIATRKYIEKMHVPQLAQLVEHWPRNSVVMDV